MIDKAQFATTSLDAFKSASPELASAVLENSSTKIFLKHSDTPVFIDGMPDANLIPDAMDMLAGSGLPNEFVDVRC